jgi:hypothetical protein
VLGLPTYNDAATIAVAAKAVQAALGRRESALVVLADSGSNDATRSIIERAVPPDRLVSVQVDAGPDVGDLPYHGHIGRLRALAAILTEARHLDAAACAVLDVASPAHADDWIDRLVTPVLDDGYEFASPHSPRRPHEGAVTKGIVYPVVRALYGHRLRQPAASEFCCSGRLVSHYLDQEYWHVEGGRTGIDLWLSTTALADRFRACEVELSRPTRPPPQGVDLGTTLVQVIGALFADLVQRESVWQRVRGSSPLPVVGTADVPPAEEHSAPPPGHATTLLDAFRFGYRELRDVWTWVLPPRTLVALRRLSDASSGPRRFDDELWASVIYDFAIGYAQQVLPRDQLLRSLTPLYSGWLGALLLETAGSSATEIDTRLEALCVAFEALKRELIARWRWPERLR